jgi:hypothetical protein
LVAVQNGKRRTVEPAGDALNRLDAHARAVRLAHEEVRDPRELDAVVRALLGRVLEDWPEDVPLAGVR